MWVSPKPNTIIKVLKVKEELDCMVCVRRGIVNVCEPKDLTLKDATNTSVQFNCPQPQEAFAVEINREIGAITSGLI